MIRTKEDMLNYLNEIPTSERIDQLVQAKKNENPKPEQLRTASLVKLATIQGEVMSCLEEYLVVQGISPSILKKWITWKVEADLLANLFRGDTSFLSLLTENMSDFVFLFDQPIKIQNLSKVHAAEEESTLPEIESVFNHALNTLQEIRTLIDESRETFSYDTRFAEMMNKIYTKSQDQTQTIHDYFNHSKDELSTLSESEREQKHKSFLNTIDQNFFVEHTPDFQAYMIDVWMDGVADFVEEIDHKLKLLKLKSAHLKKDPNAEINGLLPPILKQLEKATLVNGIKVLEDMISDIRVYDANIDEILSQYVNQKVVDFKKQINDLQ